MQRTQPHNSRRGFTLVEMLVVISILLILSYMSLSIYNVAADSDRIRSSARQIQSYLEGARDRAILAGRNDPDSAIGVRFLANPNGPQGTTSHVTVNSMVFVKKTEPITGELIAFGTLGNNSSRPEELIVEVQDDRSLLTDPDKVSAINLGSLVAQSLLSEGAKIQVFRTPDSRITQDLFVNSVDTVNNRLTLNEPVTFNNPRTAGNPGPTTPPPISPDEYGPFRFKLELEPTVMANQEPRTLGTGIAIDIRNNNGDISEYPAAWSASAGRPFDIMFSPRGTVTGSAAASGLIHLVLRDVADIEKEVTLGNVDDPNREGEELIVTLFTRTGHISSHPVHPSDTFQFAETGQVAQ